MSKMRLTLTVDVRDARSTFELLTQLDANPNLKLLFYEGQPVEYDDGDIAWEEEDYGGVVVTPQPGTFEGNLTPADIEATEQAAGIEVEESPVEWPERDAAPVLARTATIEDAVAAARRVNHEKNTAALVKLLAEFNVKRVSELPADLFGAFVERAEEICS